MSTRQSRLASEVLDIVASDPDLRRRVTRELERRVTAANNAVREANTLVSEMLSLRGSAED